MGKLVSKFFFSAQLVQTLSQVDVLFSVFWFSEFSLSSWISWFQNLEIFPPFLRISCEEIIWWFWVTIVTVIFAFRYFKLSWNTSALSQSNGSNFSGSSIRSVIILVIKQIGLPLRGRPILWITRMITDRNGLYSVLACVSQKTRKLYGPEKPFVRLRPAYFVKLVFLYVVKEIKIKITAKFCDTEHFRFEDTKRIMSPKKFRVFRETGLWYHLTIRLRARVFYEQTVNEAQPSWLSLVENEGE